MSEEITLPSGLRIEEITQGTGQSPVRGKNVTIHYVGTLASNGQKFDSSRDRGNPFTFIIGVGQVIKGFDEGVGSMKVGGKRLIKVPAKLGYGSRGAGNVIPPDAEIHFEVELLSIEE